MFRHFIIALQFLTRIPVPHLQDISQLEIGRSFRYYPLVGLVIGFFLLALGWLISDIPSTLQASLVLLLWIIITGALHLDGLADSADAWLGGHGDREKTLAIMKDAACGPAGVIALVIILLIKFNALNLILQEGKWMFLLLTPLLARTAVLFLFQTTTYVRPGGLGEALASYYSHGVGSIILLAVCLATLLMMGISGLIVILALLITVLLLRGLMIKRIGGTTGDTAGALIEISEVVLLVAGVLI